MTHKSRREIARAVERLREASGPGEFSVSSEVFEVTEEMVEEEGSVRAPLPDDAEVIHESDVVTAWVEHVD